MHRGTPESTVAQRHARPVSQMPFWQLHGHSLLQAPQCRGLKPRFVSHPAAGVQSPKPVLQVKLQPAGLQTGVAFGPGGQTTPQAPQFWMAFRLVSQPSPEKLLQFPQPAAHRMVHAPPLHEGTAFGAEHTSPHPPQF